MPWSIKDNPDVVNGPSPGNGVYDYTQPGQQYSSLFIRDNTWKPTPDQRMKIDQAMWANSQSTPMDALRGHAPFNVVAVPATPVQPTIDDVLNMTAGQTPQMTFSDFSGTAGSYEGSPRNNISIGNTGSA